MVPQHRVMIPTLEITLFINTSEEFTHHLQHSRQLLLSIITVEVLRGPNQLLKRISMSIRSSEPKIFLHTCFTINSRVTVRTFTPIWAIIHHTSTTIFTTASHLISYEYTRVQNKEFLLLCDLHRVQSSCHGAQMQVKPSFVSRHIVPSRQGFFEQSSYPGRREKLHSNEGRSLSITSYGFQISAIAHIRWTHTPIRLHIGYASIGKQFPSPSFCRTLSFSD